MKNTFTFLGLQLLVCKVGEEKYWNSCDCYAIQKDEDVTQDLALAFELHIITLRGIKYVLD